MKVQPQIFLGLIFLFSSFAGAQKQPEALISHEMSGKFRLNAVTKTAGDAFNLDFEKISTAEKKHDPVHIFLEVSTPYKNLTVSQIYDIDASIVGRSAVNTFLASQVTVFMNMPEGKTPIILLSKKFPAPVHIKSSSFIKYHTPQSDFRIF